LIGRTVRAREENVRTVIQSVMALFKKWDQPVAALDGAEASAN
jgi:hypothetical protein